MAFDPFPGTAQDQNTEQRLLTIFKSLGSLLVVPTDPLDKKNGIMWLNTTERKLKVYSEGVTWTIGSASAES